MVQKYLPPSSLLTLHLHECYKRDILDWFACEPGHHAERVVLGIVAPADASAIGRYFHRVGSSLRQLEFGFAGMDPGGDAGKH